YKRREQGTGNREQGANKKQKLLSLKLSQKKDVFKRCVARKKRNRSRGVQKTLYMRFHENSMKNVIDLIFLGHLKFAKSLYRFANRFLANLRTIR
ncbi:hypothetical protein OA07_26790, partial [Aphanizomenon flos-aquae 2012/KM1/D3]